MPVTAVRSAAWRRRPGAGDERGVYGPFIAVIGVALLFLGGIAYDGPRLTAARQDAAHVADDAALVAAGIVAAGGTLEDARATVERRLADIRLVYGHDVTVSSIHCAGARVEVVVRTGYYFRSALGLVRHSVEILAVGVAEAVVLGPGGERVNLAYLGACPL